MAALPTLMQLLQKTAAWFTERGISNGRREAEWIFAETLGMARLDLYTRFDMPLSPEQVTTLRALVTRRGSHREPLAYILGNQPFHGLDLQVSSAVLVPRPETEQLVDLALAELGDTDQAIRMLDVGTGSGAIALALAAARPHAVVHASDASDAALAIARANAERHALTVTFHHGHLATNLPGDWRVITANLPYIADGERELCDPELKHEPSMALYADDNGLALIAELVADAPRLLASDGRLWLEHGFAQADPIRELAAAAGLTATSHRDDADHWRFTEIWRG